jgi:hypothetical protein
MTTTRTLSILSALLASVALVAAGCGDSKSGSDGGSNAQSTSQVLPVPTNPIDNASKAPGLRIDSVLVENNVDPATNKDAPDHLEILLENTGKSPLQGFEVYYEIADPKTGDHEGYYTKLTGFSVAPGEKRAVHFDSTGAPDHFPDNEFSLYHSSKNALDVNVTVSAQGAAVQTASVKKDPGGDENPDE